jgi:hypothetical protein
MRSRGVPAAYTWIFSSYFKQLGKSAKPATSYVTQGEDSASVRWQVSAASPRPFVLAYWRSLPLPPIITTLFAVHQWVKRRAARRGKATFHV